MTEEDAQYAQAIQATLDALTGEIEQGRVVSFDLFEEVFFEVEMSNGFRFILKVELI